MQGKSEAIQSPQICRFSMSEFLSAILAFSVSMSADIVASLKKDGNMSMILTLPNIFEISLLIRVSADGLSKASEAALIVIP